MAGLVIVFCSYVRNSFVTPQVSTMSNNGYQQTVPETYKMQKGYNPGMDQQLLHGGSGITLNCFMPQRVGNAKQ